MAKFWAFQKHFLVCSVTLVLADPAAGGVDRIDLFRYRDWAPQTETNCATTALFASGAINDLMHVDLNDLSQFLLPYCYVKSDSNRNALVVGFGTSKDQQDYRRLLHVFYVDVEGTAINKAGSSFNEKIEVGSSEGFNAKFGHYFHDMSESIRQPISGEVEYYKAKRDARCPLNEYEFKLQKLLRGSNFFRSREYVQARLRNFEVDFTIKDPAARLLMIEELEEIERRLEVLSQRNFETYKRVAAAEGLRLEFASDFSRIYPLVKREQDLISLEEFFYLRLARKQIRMTLGLNELDPLPKKFKSSRPQ